MCPWAVPSAWLQLLCWRVLSKAWQGQLQARHSSVSPSSDSSDSSDLVKDTLAVSTVCSPAQKGDLRASRGQGLGAAAGAVTASQDPTVPVGSELAVGNPQVRMCLTAPKPARLTHSIFSFLKKSQDWVFKRSCCWIPLT